jgi:DNA adenine methylase
MKPMQHEPFLRWAGGKRWLVIRHPDLFPDKYGKYIEPFLGSGAVFFHMQPAKALLCDVNADLINAYQAIKDDWETVQNLLNAHKKRHSKDYYYKIRENIPAAANERAARFIYLNRTCWNGLYRVNLNGKFNVPIGVGHRVVLDTDNFELTSKILKKAQLKVQDFSLTIKKAKEGDLLFVDPPYTVNHNLNGFLHYNEHIFKWSDQERLRDCLFEARDRGVHIILCNADHESIRNLYKGFGKKRTMDRVSTLASDAAKRRATTELVMCSNIS